MLSRSRGDSDARRHVPVAADQGHGRLFWPNRLWPTEFGQPFLVTRLAKPTLASVSVLVVWPTLAKTDFGQTDFGQTEFDLCLCVCVFVCVCVCLCVFVCVCVCVLCSVGVGFTVSVWGFTCGCWFQGFGLVMFGAPGTALPRTALPGTTLPGTALPKTTLPGTALPLDRPKFRSFFFPLPPQNSFFSSLSGCLLVEFWWCFADRDPQMCTFGLSGCRVNPQRLRSHTKFGPRYDVTTPLVLIRIRQDVSAGNVLQEWFRLHDKTLRALSKLFPPVLLRHSLARLGL